MDGQEDARIAGTVPLVAVIEALRAERVTFHSETDFQHAFAWAVRRLTDDVARLELFCHPDFASMNGLAVLLTK